MKLNFNKCLSTIYISIFKIFPVGFNRGLSKFFKKLHDLNLKSSYGSDFISELDIENTKFKLWLMKNDNQAQSVYQPLHKKKNFIYNECYLRIRRFASNNKFDQIF